MDRLAYSTALLGDLIAFPTVSRDSNLDLIHWAANRLESCGAAVEVFPDDSGQKANLFATIGPQTPGGLVLSGHSDVVPVDGQNWTTDPFHMAQVGDRLFGRGSCDMKGFIACVLALAPEMAKWPLRRPVHIALTHDEEVGCLGAQALVTCLQEREIRPALAIIGEPTSMRVIEGHKGCCEYTTVFEGLEGHGSAPEKGVNAAEYAVRYAAHLMSLAKDVQATAPATSPFDPPWTTVNIGRISGGTVHNVIPHQAVIDWEMRQVQEKDAVFIRQEIDRFATEVLLPQMAAVHPVASVTRHVVGEIAGLVPLETSQAAELVARLTGANGRDTAAFGTEAGVFQAMGIDCVVCGPGSIEQAHKADEYVTQPQMQACLDMLQGLRSALT